ncbi:nitrate reductase [Alteromonas profundi]|nr:nitrate reductase [Alteromonas profundi]
MTTPTPELTRQQMRQSTCPYCGVGCGVDISCNVTGGAVSLDKITGTPEHPANHGRLCVKGTNLLETNDLKGRLLHPTVAGEKVAWDTATNLIADKISQTIAQFGADAVAFYVSGQLLTEDYYIANKLMKGFIGSANIDTNSRLCMSSAVAAYKRAFGEDVVPCNYTDIETTDLLVLTGSNTAWAHPVLFQRIARAKQRNPTMKVVVIDPRKTETCTIADLHLPLKGGSDVALFNGLLRYAHSNKQINSARVATYAQGLDAAIAAAKPWDLSAVAQYCDLDIEDVRTFFTWFSQAPSAVTFYSMGVNQSSQGVDKANAIINCHLAFEQIGRVGTGPFSITGQPNAMGGREVGGLANMLVAHMDIENEAHRTRVKEFWQAPSLCETQGLKAVDMFDAMALGKIKFVWIMGTNPVVSMPHRERVEAALRKCDTVVVSDIVATNDTLAFADIALPATGWSEKDGMVTNSERRMSRQRGILPPPGEAKHDWQIMCDVANKLGYLDAFSYSHPGQIFDEFARLTACENKNERLLNLAPLVGMSQTQYDNFSPLQWPLKEGDDGTLHSVRPFSSLIFPTPNGKARCIAVTPAQPTQRTCKQYPYVLNSGRARDQWHTMTRTGKTAKLHAAMPHATVTIHPDDAKALGIKQHSYAQLSSAVSKEEPCIFPVKLDKGIRKGDLFVPIHWSATWGSHSKLAKLYASATDAISGQPELKHAAVSLGPKTFNTYGMVCMREEDAPLFNQDCVSYWAKTQLENGVKWAIACEELLAESISAIVANIPKHWVLYQRKDTHSAQFFCTDKDQLCAYFSVGDSCMSETPHWQVPDAWVDSLLNQSLSAEDQSNLLYGKVDESFTQGPLVCSCFEVREKTIQAAVQTGCHSLDALGTKLKCGTNCGSCKPRLTEIIDDTLSELALPLATSLD